MHSERQCFRLAFSSLTFGWIEFLDDGSKLNRHFEMNTLVGVFILISTFVQDQVCYIIMCKVNFGTSILPFCFVVCEIHTSCNVCAGFVWAIHRNAIIFGHLFFSFFVRLKFSRFVSKLLVEVWAFYLYVTELSIHLFFISDRTWQSFSKSWVANGKSSPYWYYTSFGI